ncbi:hypothetical protein DNU06_00175 [Putridiphycobacter roseus]|uniref:Right handed beta helix domain-containing protein n=1 Tax=Putridiphycobacter roseus TaxID=2219161 RepID=A0A2W1NK32_9FLAO|nr:right-handed parallel beta-helix repeat-containing protein [Putridiphycobacter roseus]PZE18286.1 hypothetical protein DNU06_00175 [Putridiphycobacter roseus]
MNKFYEHSALKRTFILLLSLLLVCILFFPTTTFDLSKKTIKFGVKTFYGLTTSLEKKDYLEILIDENAQEKLANYRNREPVKKKWVDIKILIDGEFCDAKIKYHGTHMNHYINDKYSYSLKLSKTGPKINNARRFKIIKSEEAEEVISLNFLGSEAGLISATGTFKILKINNKNVGSYYFVEDIKKEFLERNFGITNFVILSNTSDWTRKEGRPHISSLNNFHGHLDSKDDENYSLAVAEYERFTDNIKNDRLELILKQIDQKYMAKFLALMALNNNSHHVTGDNLKFVYDFSRGHFYPIYRPEYKGSDVSKELNFEAVPDFNSLVFKSFNERYHKYEWNHFFKLLLSVNSIRNDRDKFLYKFYSNRNHISNQLDSVFNSIKTVQNADYNHGKLNLINYSIKTLIDNTLDIYKDYISNAHIYGSIDTTAGTIDIALDAFAQIKIINKSTNQLVSILNGVIFSPDLSYKNIILSIKLPNKTFNPKKDFLYINAVTGDTLSKKKIYFNYINRTSYQPSEINGLDQAGIKYKLLNDTIYIKKGKYQVENNICLPTGYTVSIEEGVTIMLDSNIHFQINGSVYLNGTESNPINITSMDKHKPFGTFSIIGNGKNTAYINNTVVSGGKSSFFNGRLFTGQFAIYECNVQLINSTFSNSQGDDGINIKYSKVNISNCFFIDNYADQVDLDFCFANVKSSVFYPKKIDANGDGLDISGSYVHISECELNSFLDKGLSLGEKSTAIVSNCVFRDNLNAIAVKDETTFYSLNNSFFNNQKIITSYIKKGIFNDPRLYLDNSYDSSSLHIINGKIELISKIQVNENIALFDERFKQYLKSGSIEDRLFFK